LEISPAAEELLQRYRWPGNIRELQNVIRSVALFCEGDVVDVEHLSEFPELFHEGGAVERRGERQGDRSFDRDRGDRPRTAPLRAPDAQTQPPAPAQPSTPPTTTRDVMRRVEAEAAHEGLALGDLKRRIEFEAIANAMRQTGGNITRAAAMLKMKRPRLSQIVNGNEELKAIKQASRDGDDD
jgi:sigma-54 specific flagellar transcriptional regulator A